MTNAELFELLGIIAGFLTTMSFLPQAIKAYRSRSANDYSLLGLLMFVTGVILWLVYGILIGSLAIIMTNIVTLILSGFILVYKVRFG